MDTFWKSLNKHLKGFYMFSDNKWGGTVVTRVLRVEEEENIAELSPQDKHEQISSCNRL